ncbi:SdrD B-like domain-containing protein, partial [Alteriqipengyuania sp. WL0013]|uniref:SdrD B-like domain-containing protein n=1 Tax=Alteriqipengyuania sp. WL0013 TaxID=3110773 RepID=UPI002C462D4B
MPLDLDQSSFFQDLDNDGEKDDNETTFYDLTTKTGSAAEINGSLFFIDQPDSSAGTGLIQAIVRVQDTGNDATPGFENGYNSSARPVSYEENTSPSFTTSITLDEVPKVVIDGVEYYEFRLDINQLNSSPLLSLDNIQVFTSSIDANGNGIAGEDADFAQGTIDGAWFAANATKVYDLDGDGDSSILLDYSLQAGSGKSDMFFYVPVANFGAVDPAETYVTLYSEFGAAGDLDASDNLIAGDDSQYASNDESDDDVNAIYGTYTTNDGFEEWSVSKELGGYFISGYKWEDSNGDGLWNNGETGAGGFKIDYIITYRDGNGANAPLVTISGSTITSDGTADIDGDGAVDPEGYYVIPVPLGAANNTEYSITLTEAAKENWVNSYDGDAVADRMTFFKFAENDLVSDVGSISGRYGFTETMNFGNYRLGRISGTKYEDPDGDIDTVEGRTTLAGVRIDLLDGAGNLLATTYTDGDGNYAFEKLAPGDYQVRETAPDGSYAISNVTVMLDGQLSGFDQDVDFVNTFYGRIEGYKYEDLDGVLGGTTKAWAGVTISLLDGDGNVIRETQ